MSQSSIVEQLAAGLKSRHRDIQNKAAQELFLYVKTELREMPTDQRTQFFEQFDSLIVNMVLSSEVHEKKGGVLTIKCLVTGDAVNTATRISRYSNCLRDLLPSSDVSVMEMAAKTLVKLAMLRGSESVESFAFDVMRAFEWLSKERNEGKRHAAVLVLRELATAMPTYFYQQVKGFFEYIFNATKDPKPAIREGAGQALRAALTVIAQRETTKQHQHKIDPTKEQIQWTNQCYEEAIICFEDTPLKEKGVTRDDRIHGALIIFHELLRCADANWERKYNALKSLYPEPLIHVNDDFFNFTLLLKAPFKEKVISAVHSLYTFDSINTPKYNTNSVASSNILVHESKLCKNLILDKFNIICDNVLEQKNSRSTYVQQALYSIIPRLAAIDPKKFIQDYLPGTAQFLFNTMRHSKEKERNMAFVTFGYVAVALKHDIGRYHTKIFEIIKTALDQSKKNKQNLDPVFMCITLLAHAVEGAITTDISDLLNPMLATGLNPGLTICLREIAEKVPNIRREISEGLIQILHDVLFKFPLQDVGTPKHNIYAGQHVPTASKVVLALKTLGSFNFEDYSLLEFCRRCADYYVNSEQPVIRVEAVQTCTRLLKSAIIQDGEIISDSLKNDISHVIDRLLTIAITDENANVRLCVLKSLDKTFDAHLAQPECLSYLSIALNDEVFEVRESAIMAIGRLSAINPGYVTTSLRQTLVRLLTELEHSGMSRNKEQGARLLHHLIVSSPGLVSTYVKAILEILVPKLKEPDTNPGVVLNVLRAIGDLAFVNSNSAEMEKWVDELLPILLEMLGDSGSTEKRDVALWTLGHLVGATGRVVTPYYKYPFLIDILIGFLKTEQQRSIRRETIRVFGLLGALDPYKHKMNKGLIDSQNANILISISDVKSDLEHNGSTTDMLVNTGNMEEYYPAIAISTLMQILRDPTLSPYHTSVVQAVTFIFEKLGIKCVPYLPQVLPNLLDNIRTSDINIKEFLFKQLSTLIEIVKQHILPYMGDVFKLIKEFWYVNPSLQGVLIKMIERIAVALGAEFTQFLSQLMPHILKILNHDDSKNRMVTLKLLEALQKFGNTLDTFSHLVIPPVVRLFEPHDHNFAVSVAAFKTIDYFIESLHIVDFSSRIIHPLIRVLDHYPSVDSIRREAMAVLTSLMIKLGKQYLVYVPLVQRVMLKHKISDLEYEKYLVRIQVETTISMDDELRERKYKVRSDDSNLTTIDSAVKQKYKVNLSILEQAWRAERRVSKDDWLEWLNRLSIGLLKESPSTALRACRALAQTYPKLLRDLFNAAFVSCWTDLPGPMQKELTLSLKQALEVDEITQTILNLAEFMEHWADFDNHPLPIEPQQLGNRAMECRAYAKALYYKEEECHKSRNDIIPPHILDALILINNKLQQREAAQGLIDLPYAEDKINVRWHEKMHSWEKALNAYMQRINDNEDDMESQLGYMRCLEAMGEWSELSNVADLTSKKWEGLPENDRNQAGRLAAVAAWGMEDFERMEEFVIRIPENTQDGAFYRAVLSVHREDYPTAQRLIDETRDLLDTELTAMAGESYERAYGAMVCVQMLSELEEVIQYKLIPKRREAIKSMWWRRLQGGQRLVEDWRRIIQLRSLVVPPHEDIHTWLKYASLCRKSGSLKLSYKTLVMLLGYDPSQHPDVELPVKQPHVSFAYTKHLWMDSQQNHAFAKLKTFVEKFTKQINCALDEMTDENRRLLARCYLRLGMWQKNNEGITDTSIDGILRSYDYATKLDPNWYKAWHSWAYTNFKVVQLHKQAVQMRNTIPEAQRPKPDEFLKPQREDDIVNQYAVPAVNGFFRSINLIQGNSLQDTLRLLTLWFDYGDHTIVNDALLDGMRMIKINTWLQVIPQLIARIDTPRKLVAQLIHHLLIDIGKSHPQALVSPLTVASKSTSSTRRTAAYKILQSMRDHSMILVDQAIMVSEELIRVAILWHEQWHEGLEEASRQYFGDRNIKGMFETLEPLHAMLERGAQTLKEVSFVQVYSADLTHAKEWCTSYKKSGNIRDLNQAWDLYYHVFRRISKQLPQLTSLELQYVSTKLMNCKNLELAVPGSYTPGQDIIRISYIQTNLQVITSKQRPRKLCIRGSNGKDYMFLLKGHEDLRQDERVMQLFGLVNTLLLNDPNTFRHNLAIQRYAVIPLSTNSGLIGWVPHCDTLHTLIRDYREKKKIPLNTEHRIMLKLAPDYDHITLMQKIEIFESAIKETPGNDLAKLLWLKSPSSEVWFERRTNYIRSLAVMSMVGYILGLGDRHPSNLMLDRLSGKILHIDFGDCFEVAMTREKFPEKIPFRLTRMLIKAMEVIGINGTYKKTCESVMMVLRRNKDSLMAVLEAFVYDPLLNWRILDNTTEKAHRTKTNENGLNYGGVDVDDASSSGGSGEDTVSFSIRSRSKIQTSDTTDGGFLNGSDDNGFGPNLPDRPIEIINDKARDIVDRVKQKLTGNDFCNDFNKDAVTVEQQVDLLIQAATNNENLCQCYIGWCPFW